MNSTNKRQQLRDLLTKYLTYQLFRKSHYGFTLIELLITSFLTGLLMLIAAYGLTVIINKNEQTEGESDRRVEFNRAIEYISEDIKAAKSISPGSEYTISPSSPVCATATPILKLVIPEGVSEKIVVYYLNDMSSPPSCGDAPVWRKPALIKRVENPNPISTPIPGSNGNELVDAVSTQNITPPPSPASLCPPGWTISPATNQKGFYACLDKPTNARSVELHLVGYVSQNPAKSYKVSRKIFARSKP
jgi:prepilin-type N-terminal cleavage/methylation domain-containing protein